MTIPRVLLALALLVMGGMLWGLHKDIYGIKEGLVTQGATVAERINAVNDHISLTGDKLLAAAGKPPQVITKTEIQTQYKTKTKVKYRYLKAGRPKVHKPKGKYMRITAPLNTQLDGLYMVMPETPPIYSTPLPP